MGESFKNNPLVMALRQDNETNAESRQIPFTMEEDGKLVNYFGAFQKLSYGDIVVLTTVPVNNVMEGVYTTLKNNIFLTGVVFFLSIAIILVFTRLGISSHF